MDDPRLQSGSVNDLRRLRDLPRRAEADQDAARAVLAEVVAAWDERNEIHAATETARRTAYASGQNPAATISGRALREEDEASLARIRAAHDAARRLLAERTL